MALVTTGVQLQVATTAGTWRLSERPLLDVGAIEGTDPDAFGNVAGAVRLGSGAVMVADGMALSVRLFRADGRAASSAGRKGDGPGEFRTVLSMHRCAGDSAFVYDPASSRISVFAPAGDFARSFDVRHAAKELRAPPYEFACSTAGVLAYLNRSPSPPERLGPRRPDVAVTVVHRDGTVVPLGTFPAPERYFDGSNDFPRPLGKPTSIAVGSNAVFVGTGDHVGDGDAFEVAVFSLRGERTGTIRARLPRKQITSRHVARYIDEQIARRGSRADPAALRRLYTELEYPETFPAFARLMVDPSDNLWIEEYPVPGEDVRTWRVHARNGALIGTLALPKSFRLTEIGRNYVVGVWRDELDVQSVRVFGLVKTVR